MSIAYDSAPPRGPRRAASAPSSLLNRIQKAPLAERLSQDDSSTQGPSSYVHLPHFFLLIITSMATRRGVGPIRSRRGGEGRGGGGGGRVAPRAPKKPKTAEDLDKELDLFMGDGPRDGEEATPTASEPAPTAAQPEVDVEMA